jgi:hypothetical protein
LGDTGFSFDDGGELTFDGCEDPGEGVGPGECGEEGGSGDVAEGREVEGVDEGEVDCVYLRMVRVSFLGGRKGEKGVLEIRESVSRGIRYSQLSSYTRRRKV